MTARTLLTKLRKHARSGTLLEAVFGGVHAELARVRWHGARDSEQAAKVLALRGREFLRDKGASAWLLTLGDRGAGHVRLDQRLDALNLRHRSASLDELVAWNTAQLQDLAGILCAYPDARQLTAAARQVARHPVLGTVPFEYAAGLDREAGVFRRLDEYRDTFFVSPVLLDDPTPYALYEESLQHFAQKCGLRDFLDLYQFLRAVVTNGVPGDIAEFGSYQGHSGWLIARTLQALGSDKRVYLFDTFDEFPREPLGIDHFWNRTHGVDFAQVQARFAGLERVVFVRGDFTRTLPDSGLKQVALAHIDCDSYRATRFLIDTLFARHLSTGGLLICEDYGHPALLGARAAVHESVAHLPRHMPFYSQFSGLYAVLKL